MMMTMTMAWYKFCQKMVQSLGILMMVMAIVAPQQRQLVFWTNTTTSTTPSTSSSSSQSTTTTNTFATVHAYSFQTTTTTTTVSRRFHCPPHTVLYSTSNTNWNRNSNNDGDNHILTTTTEETSQTRTKFLQKCRRTMMMMTGSVPIVAAVVPFRVNAAVADTDAAAALKGTKKDPAYEACLSQCMYDCTKPKGVEQKSRSVCLPECKVQCATTKQQLMMGTPLR
jgi:hypothetical protein